uniref:ShKT domain-containing protein n=1 Tax=Pseudictyota dubia TaxID=2749911 RepID=A0A7R9Z229_9STRA|mmetsp:Transcript_20286/g.38156  ORF Transcript_20286/g.38156 Transcript_20286/m.38156 type:complete len:253 (+) Transcript_20286:154-912(+)
MPNLRHNSFVLILAVVLLASPPGSSPQIFASASVSVDKLPECEEMAQKGDCTKPERMEFMLKNCAASCEKQPGVRKVEVMPIGDDEPQFFDLSAEDAHGNVIEFDDFEGYVTLVVNCAKICGATEHFYKALDHIHDVWPYTVEILAFPFWKKDTNETPETCPSLREAELSKDRKIHVMKEVELKGPNMHPVYKFFKNKFNQEVDDSYSTFFLVNPDGNLVEAHFGTHPTAIKQYIQKHLKEDLAGRAKIGEL